MRINKQNIIDTGSNSITQLERINKDQVVKHTEFYDLNSLNQNQRIRDSGMLHNGVSRLHDEYGSDYRAVISCPSVEQWELFKTQNRSVYDDIMSKQEAERMRGVKAISLLEPNWILQLRL